MISIFTKSTGKSVGIIIWIVLCFTKVIGQEIMTVKGTILDNQTQQGISYSTIALYALEDSTLVTGTLSDDNGNFELQFEQKPFQYMLVVNFVGYEPWTVVIDPDDTTSLGALTVFIQPATVQLDEAVVVSDRLRAERSFDKTAFLVNKKMLDASNTGIDILRHIPSVQIDFMQNVKLEGSSNILILVDGKERDKSFLLQLNAKHIDKVEIINTPGANFDGSATGIINIVLKKDKNMGFSGNVILDIPLRKKEMYLFPIVNLNWGLKKMNLYGSYKGDVTYFDLVEKSTLSHFSNNNLIRKIATTQYLRQENWEHSFVYGLDYFMDENNVLNLYANHRIYSNETDGLIKQMDDDDLHWAANKDETDLNHSGYYSLYYKHLFGEEHELAMDVNYYHYEQENTTIYHNNQLNDDQETIKNHLAPKQSVYGLKLDYTRPVTENFKASAGLKLGLTHMEELGGKDFNYYDHLAAAYGAITYNRSQLTVNAGLRVERSLSGIKDSFDYDRLDWLPNAVINYQLNQTRSLKFSYSRRIVRPYIYQLNPTVYIDDPFTMRSGNEHLAPELHNKFTVDYSVLLGNNYLSVQGFYKTAGNSIGNLSFLNEAAILESRFNNLGAINTYGVQLTAALKPVPIMDFGGYFKFFGESAKPNDLATEFRVESMENMGIELGVSTAFSFKHDITASLAMQYSSPKIDVQNKTYDDFIYFITVDKSIKKNFKFGVSFAPLFIKKYTYHGLKVEGGDFKLDATGDIQLPTVPLFFKVSYQFASGKSSKKIERENEIIDNKVKKGL